MEFPLNLNCLIDSHNGRLNKQVFLNDAFTCILGPNGSGKTHLLRSITNSIRPLLGSKKAKFISAGRIGMFEQFRSNYDGHRHNNILYENARFGAKESLTRRHEIETLEGAYQSLASRPDILLKIRERLQKIFNRDLIIEWDAGYLKILFTKLDGSKPYSSGREASGLMHLVGILAALYDDEIGALFIDEPEVSLHPQLQAFLLAEILGVAGIPNDCSNKKIIVIATHSTEMLKINNPVDLASLIFCYDLSEDPIQISPDEKTLENKKIKNLISKLGQEHKLTLFSKRPLLVEGPSDVVICNTLANKINIFLEASGSQILPVIGKDQLPVVVKLFRLLGKDPVILADADGLSDGTDLLNQLLPLYPDIDYQVANLGHGRAFDMVKSLNSDFVNLINQNWSDIENLAHQHAYWINGHNENEIKAKKRSAFSVLLAHDLSVIKQLPNGDSWAKIRSRFEALLNLLENVGIFFLRKGSIEAYYCYSDPITSEDKIDAAIDELAFINEQDKGLIETNYNDIVRCLKFAAATDPINETRALRDLVLSIVSPCIARMQDPGNEENLNLFAKTILQDQADLFHLEKNGDSLIVHLKSNIINSSHFPLRIDKDNDVVRLITQLLK
ncbi:ATP-dependent nuclease [Acinetobacter johnsonii]|uniref:ATP-dependent nuclease n=1 Tax=Acinetobacter johnsonii TaxID=40214 RepID=UPI001F32F3B7|nr:AAA family ATPase [Acinetobacter johnsonii]UJA00091.1 AAA family ATPase [Acinetobacter johnsonii]